jgi:hypothetical protein
MDMDLLLNILRGLTAILLPISALIMAALALVRIHQQTGRPPEGEETCARCSEAGSGGTAVFHYTEAVGNARERAARKKLVPTDTKLLGSETHFVCDRCAKAFARSEAFQILLMVLPYPIYLYVIIPLFAENGIFANFLIETLLIVLSVAGTTSAFDMLRAVQIGQTPLSEARDRVAIQERRKILGKKFSYYSRIGHRHLKE